MGENYNGYSIMPDPNNPGWIVRYPVFDVALGQGGAVYYTSTKALAKAWIDVNPAGTVQPGAQ